MHMVLDGVDWKHAMARHKGRPDDGYIRQVLGIYRERGYTYLRDGGDKHGASVRARELAGEYGICYRTPIAPISMAGHYGGFIGYQVADLREYADLVKQFRRDGADFIKIMISGLMDFDRFGVLSEPGLDPETIREMIHIVHGEGLAVMAHANGARVMEAAAAAGVDSIEHGAYADEDALRVMAENKVVWVPTLSTIGNLCHSEEQKATKNPQYPEREDGFLAELGMTPHPSFCFAKIHLLPREKALGREFGNDRKVGAAGQILESALRNVRAFVAMGGLVAPGTDAGAYAVPHGCCTEEGYLRAAGVTQAQIDSGIKAIMERF